MGRRRGWILGWLPLGWEALLAKVWWQSLQELLDSSGCLVICNTFLIQAAPVYVDGSEHAKPGRKHQALHNHAKMQFPNAWQYCLAKQQTAHAQPDSSLAS